MTETTAPDLGSLSTVALMDTRPGLIFWRSVRDHLSGVLGWGIGFGVLIAVTTILFPLLESSNTALTVFSGLGLLDNFLAGHDLEDITGFAGYLALQVMAWAPLLLSIYLIPTAIQAVAVEEQRGTLDILLSTPISRWRFLTEKLLALVAALFVILALMGVGMLLSVRFLIDVELELINMVASIWHLVPIALVMLTGTLLLSVTVRDHRRAGSWAALLVIISYFMRTLADLTPVEPLVTVRNFSFFYYYRSVSALNDGFQWEFDLLLLGVAAGLFTLAIIAFQRRDIRV